MNYLIKEYLFLINPGIVIAFLIVVEMMRVLVWLYSKSYSKFKYKNLFEEYKKYFEDSGDDKLSSYYKNRNIIKYFNKTDGLSLNRVALDEFLRKCEFTGYFLDSDLIKRTRGYVKLTVGGGLVVTWVFRFFRQKYFCFF